METTDVTGGPPMAPTDAVVGCDGLTKTFGRVTAVDDATLSVQNGEWLSIVGPNGAGKTTLLNLLNGFYDPDEGSVLLDGEDVTDQRAFKRARKGMARTFQGQELFEEESVLENILTMEAVKHRPNLLSAMLYYRAGNRTEAANERRAEEIIDYLELWEHRHAPVNSLPLGTRRRVDLARALALEPTVLLLDEVMSGLTFDEKYDMVRFISDLNEEEDLTVVMIEHDLEVVTDVSDRMVVIHKGAVIARGPPGPVSDHPEVARVYTGVE
jgi:branched-chain amino acid transport system ATP-binding protein